MRKRFVALGMSALMIFTMAGCGNQQKSTENKQEQTVSVRSTENKVHKIGVAVYSNTDDENRMFKEYYTNYLANSFQAEFIYSSDIKDYKDEMEFVDSAKKEGCEGIISFITNDLSEIVKYCAKQNMYYMLGSGTQSEDEFNTVKNEKNFLGIMGPSVEDEAEAGQKMIQSLGNKNGSKKTYILLSGGSAFNNFMHKERLYAMIETLQKEQGFTFEKSVDEIAAMQENALVGTSKDGGKVYICPGYLNLEAYKGNLQEVLSEAGKVDVVASTYYITPFLDTIAEQETAQKKDIQTGAIDCFSDTNSQAFHEKDSFGNSKLNFIGGKCAAMAAPAFVAMYNTVSGYPESVRNGEEAFWLNQDFWYASTPEEYEKLSTAADNVYKNIYSTDDIMNSLAEYGKQVDYNTLVNFVGKIEQ